MSILVDDQKLINLKFQYVETPGIHTPKFKFIRSKEEYEENKNDPNFKELDTSWKPLSWSDYNNIYSSCLKYKTDDKGMGISDLDFIKFRDMKLKTCLKHWSLKDEMGRAIVVTSTMIDKLYPEIAAELLTGFEKITESEIKENII